MVFNYWMDDVELFLSSLMLGATLSIFNGSPNYPNSTVLWDFAKSKIDHSDMVLFFSISGE